MAKYRPSNGSEGCAFVSEWCLNCKNDKDNDCEIYAKSLIYDVNEHSYPEELQEDEFGNIYCTDFVGYDDETIIDTKTIDMFSNIDN